MPMNWDAQADAKLMAAIIKVCDIKLSAAHLKAVAELMGPDCTPKALSHRVSAIRKKADQLCGTENDVADGPKTKRPKLTGTTAPGNTGRKARVKKNSTAQTAAQFGNDTKDDEDTRELATLNSRKRPYNARTEGDLSDESDGIEVGEDVGEGRRAGLGGTRIKAEDG